MTLIFGIADPENDRAIITADRGMWRNHEKELLREPKIWRAGKWILGVSGKLQTLQSAKALSGAHCPFPLSFTDTPAYEHPIEALRAFSQSVENAASDAAERARRLGNDKPEFGFEGVAVLGSRVFYFADGYAVEGANGFHAAGHSESAAAVASALSILREQKSDEWPAIRIAHLVVSTFERCSYSVEAPFDWMATDGTEGKWE